MADENVHGSLSGSLSATVYFNGVLEDKESMSGVLSIPSITEVNRDYEFLYNKPRIESVELIGDKSFEDLGLNKISNGDIISIIGG